MDHINPFESAAPTEHTGRDAVRRLRELGLAEEQLMRAVLRADNEALMCTENDVPNMEGILRTGKTVRYLREDLVRAGWKRDNSRGFCRTISPDESFAIVVSSGDENTGVPGATPSTKYPKGPTTVEAVATNSGQGSIFDLPEAADILDPSATLAEQGLELPVAENQIPDNTPVRWLLFRTDGDQCFVELSYPDDTERKTRRETDADEVDFTSSKRNNWISHWSERIILDPFDRGDHVQELPETSPRDGDGDDEDYDFAVTPR